MTNTSTEPSLEDRAWKAAEGRYELLDTQMRVELSGHLPHEHVRPAADAAVGLVRRELVSTYAALLEANALRDDALQHLHRLVDHQDNDCDFDHHGFCQTHSISGSEAGKCGVVEAREFLAANSSGESA